MAAAPGLELEVNDDTYTKNKHLADPIQVLPVDFGTQAPEPKAQDVAGNKVAESGSPKLKSNDEVANVSLPLGGGGGK